MDAIRQATSVPLTDPLDSELVSSVVSQAPFHQVDGVFNLRDLSDGSAAAKLRPGFVFRAGTLERVPPGVMTPFTRDLHIATIFDLRAATERDLKPEPEIPGVTLSWTESQWEQGGPTEAQRRIDDNLDEPHIYHENYMELLQSHRKPFKAVLEHVRDHPDQALLVHCTAGLDRTGVISALILALAGADVDYINHEYLLSRFGLEEARDMLVKKFFGAGQKVDLSHPRVQEHAKLPSDVWTKAFSGLEQRYGSVQDYCKQVLGFNDTDLQAIRHNLNERSQ